MPFIPGDSYHSLAFVYSPTTGASVNADSTPTATANRNGANDGAFTLTVTNITTGVYAVAGTIPSGYADGDAVTIYVTATVGGVTVSFAADQFIIDGASAGQVYTRIGAAGAGLTALGDARIAHLDADVSSRLAASAAPAHWSSMVISSGGIVSVDLVDILGSAVNTTTAQLGVNVVAVAGDGGAGGYLDTLLVDYVNGVLEVNVAGDVLGRVIGGGSSVITGVGAWALGAGGSSPLTGSQIATAVWTDTTAGDFAVVGSPGYVVVEQLGGALVGSPGVYTAASLVNAPTGGGGGGVVTGYAAGQDPGTLVWDALTIDHTVIGSMAALLEDIALAVAAVELSTDRLPLHPASTEEVLSRAQPGDQMTVALAQVVPLSNPPNSVGDCLNAARAQGFGRWQILEDRLRLYGPDGLTLVREFILDDPVRPTSRT